MVPLTNVVRVRETTAPQVISHYNLFRSAEINGGAAPGFSSGQAIDEMEALAKRALPQGFGFAWSGLSLEEIKAGRQSIYIFAIGLLLVYLTLAAQYESFVLPFIVMLGVPLAVLGALTAQGLRGLQNDIYCQIGLVMLIGLAAKNAILIVEFAEQLRDRGLSIMEAAIEAARIRLRPILMTSLAFILGVMPLVFASGAGQEGRHSVGTAVAGGMFFATFLNVIVIPVLYVSCRHSVERRTARTRSTKGVPPMRERLRRRAARALDRRIAREPRRSEGPGHRSMRTNAGPPASTYGRTAFSVLGALSVCHLLNDMVQSLLPAIYPILKTALQLDFRHIGLITLVNQVTASLLQPAIGFYTDRRPQPQSLAAGMTFTLCGLLLLAWAGRFGTVLAAAALIGVGLVHLPSRVVAPRASRFGRTAWARAVAVPGGRQRGFGARAAAGGLRGAAARSGQPGLVRRGADPRDQPALAGGRLVQTPRHGRCRCPCRGARAAPRPDARSGDRRARRAPRCSSSRSTSTWRASAPTTRSI